MASHFITNGRWLAGSLRQSGKPSEKPTEFGMLFSRGPAGVMGRWPFRRWVTTEKEIPAVGKHAFRQRPGGCTWETPAEREHAVRQRPGGFAGAKCNRRIALPQPRQPLSQLCSNLLHNCPWCHRCLRAEPVLAEGISNAIAVSADWGNTCALLADSTCRNMSRRNCVIT